MFARLLNSKLPLMIYNPCKVFSLNFFTAVFQAGGLPVFDTEFMTRQEIMDGIKQLIGADILFGVRLVTHSETLAGKGIESTSDGDRVSGPGDFQDLLNEIADLESPNLDTMVISLESREAPFEFKRFGDTKLILETRQININHRIDPLSPHALILKGNEAGGRVSNYSSFVLMQWYLENTKLPLFIHGGVGRHTASGMFAAGVSGVVLDSQVWLCDESPLSENFKKLLSNIDENDSMEITTDRSHIYRVFAKLGTKIAKTLKEKAIVVSDKSDGPQRIYDEMGAHLTPMDTADAPAVQSLFFLGQDGFFAKDFAKQSFNATHSDSAGGRTQSTGSTNTDKTIGAPHLTEVITSFFKDIGQQLNAVDAFDPMVPGSPMAKDHNTRLPLIQGPMANVSDNPDFAAQVLQAGALPFFAVGSLPPMLADTMLKNGAEKVPTFGAGLVGIEAFNPAIEKHLEMVKKYNAPFALFAGGIPSQVIELEKAGTKTYLHTPSISMMENAIKNGCKRFIFEGKEAGGHIGSLSSLVLWDAALSKLKDKDDDLLSGLSIVFAGGISTTFATHFISGISSCLSAKGVKIGIQVGTAYLFAKEIVETKSITEQYQSIVCEEDETVVIGNSVGLASRTAPTGFARMMLDKEKEMIKKGEKLEDRKRTFEKSNIGSLLIGAKGFLPDFKRMGEKYYTWFEGEEHRQKGNFLVGDALAFFKQPVTLSEIHDTFFHKNGKQLLFQHLDKLETLTTKQRSVNDEIAVIGMGCVLPTAHDPESLWESVLNKKYAIREMPQDRIRKDLYYDADKSAEDKSYTMLAGTIDEFHFDQERFGYDEKKAAKLSRTQKILLETAYQAVENAGYLDSKTLHYAAAKPERTGVIIATCLSNELGNELLFKYHYPEVLSMLRKTDTYQQLSEDEKKILAEDLRIGMEGKNAGYDPVHGMLLNIEASRVARHLGIRGVNYVVDAACASSFSALDAAIQELLTGTHDQMIVGGVNTHLAPESFIGFCKMGALSAKGSFPFDKRADGFILGEGAAVFVLKRMKDALRDNDNIIGVIKGIGASSDGRGKAIAAPNIDGQVLALKRCYDNMKADNVTPEDIDFIEAHGTSTIMGDQAELQTLKQVYARTKTGVSSIKSQIGHLLGGAGAAGLVKALLAVQKGVLPPTANFETLSPNHDLAKSLLYIITEEEKWEPEAGKTRKAAVSSYGFGGINYHVVVEEFRSDYTPLNRTIFKDPSYDFNNDRIVIAGMGVRLPGAENCDAFWEKLQSGEKQLSDIPDEHFDNRAYAEQDPKSIYHIPMVRGGVIKDFKFNNIKYRMPPTIVRSLEKGQLLGLDAAEEAIHSSGLDKLLEKGNRIGVILGTMPGERQNKNILRVRKIEIAEIIEKSHLTDKKTAKKISDEIVASIRKRIPENNEDTTPGLLSNIISGRIANHFGLNGFNYVIDASCASAFIAIDNAVKSIAMDHLDFALAGGVDANLYPAALMAFKRIGLLSPTEPRFMDDRADGYAMAEGAAIHVITTYGKAKAAGMEVLAEINQTAIRSSVPDHLLAPSEQTFVSTINACYEESGIRKNELKHLDLFAFSNILGDMVEKQVVEKCFKHDLFCGNVKPQFGYFKSANPAVAIAKMALMNRERTLLPNFTYDPEHTTLKNGTVLKSATEMVPISDREPLRFGFNVNGIGGNHGHLILSPLPTALTRTSVSKAVEKSSQAAVGAMAVNQMKKSVPPMAASSTTKADPMETISPQVKASLSIEAHGGAGGALPTSHGAAQTASTSGSPQNINRFSSSPVQRPIQGSGGTPPGGGTVTTGGKRQKMVALLSGQGAQRPGMMKELFDSDPEIRDIMERGEEIFMERRGYSLLQIMFNEDSRLNLTENTQPAVFLSSAALFERLQSRGFNPDAFIGHSVGEYTALFCSGMLDFDDAMGLIIKRSDLMKEAAAKYPGKIMVVFRNEKDTAAAIRESGLSDIYITNKNSENQTAVSGNADAIEAYCTFLTSKNIVFRKLNLSGAFHTPLFGEAAEQLREYLTKITFNDVPFSRVISNVTARPYPENRMDVKDLLARQITSPVEFIKSVEYVYESGRTHYIEIGPGRLLSNLLKKINIAEYQNVVTVDAKQGELESFKACREYLQSYSSIFTRHMPQREAILPARKRSVLMAAEERRQQRGFSISLEDDFDSFKREHAELAEKLMHEEFLRRKREAAMEAVERFNFTTDAIVISGVSVGLPGKANRVFASDNFDRILEGNNFIEPLTIEEQRKITDKNITRLFKQPDGNARFVEITRTEDVIHLAGQLGYFSLTDEYGIKAQYDVSMALGVAAGIEALKDAGIPLVMQYKRSTSGDKMIPDGFTLPKAMQDDTGVIITSLFATHETLIQEMEKYLYDKFFLKSYEEFENIYYYLMENVKEGKVKESLTDWFFKIKSRKREDFTTYKFDRNFLMNACPLGAAHLAQIIRAKGPNTLLSCACASTTQAIGVAEDWIRVGRCKRVIVIGGENATSEAQNQWIGTGFLALGAATVKKRVSEAAKPFDSDRNGTIIGSGAVGLVVEKQDQVLARGMKGQVEVLGTHMANSAYHTFNIDVPHMAAEMKRFIKKIEDQHHLKPEDYAQKLLFMSHETYTPARGGSADAEVTALKTAFNDHLKKICISNTKGFTGHTLGAAIEDVVMVKALQRRQAPPIANLTKIPAHFKELNFSSRKKIDCEYGLHLAAGFGSHFAFLFVKRIEENSFENNREYALWLEEITGSYNPELKIIDNTLCVVPGKTPKGEVAMTRPSRAFSATSTPAAPQAPATPTAVPTAATPVPVPTPPPVASAPAAHAPAAHASATPAPSAAPDAATVIDKVKEIIAEQTGYTTDMLEPDLDLEADLGIDTVKQVEIFAKTASTFGFAVPEDLKLRDLNTIEKLGAYIAKAAPGSAAASSSHGTTEHPAQASTTTAPTIPSGDAVMVSAATATSDAWAATTLAHAGEAGADASPAAGDPSQYMEKVKEIIGEQTGYTTDMLEPELDLEADLGIDTVKQVEIFAKTAATFGFAVPEDLKLRDLNTIEKLAAYIAKVAPGAAPAATAQPAAAPPTSAQVIATSAAPTAPTRADSSAYMEKVKEIIAEQTGYTTDMLDPDLDLEADLGIDTVKQVEIFAKTASTFGFAVPEDLKLRDLNTIAKLAAYIGAMSHGTTAAAAETPTAAPIVAGASATAPQTPAAPAVAGGSIEKIREIIADQTGYTPDMLDADLDLEGDLGIDTVKQVEIFANAAGYFEFPVPEDLKLRDLNTIAKLAEYIDGKIGTPDGSDDSDPTDPTGTNGPTGGGVPSDGASGSAGNGPTTPASIGAASDQDAGITIDPGTEMRRLVPVIRETGLPLTDHTDFHGKKVLMTVDHVGFSKRVATAVKAQNGKVIGIISDPATLTALSRDIDLATMYDFCDEIIAADFSSNEAAVESASKIKAVCPTPDAFLHLAPLDLCFDKKDEADASLDKTKISTRNLSEQHVKSFFLMLKELHDALNQEGKLIAALSIDSVIFPHANSPYEALKSQQIEPCFAGISGLMKSLAKEMPDTQVKIVDFTRHQPDASLYQNEGKTGSFTLDAGEQDAIVAQFINEITSKDPRVESGYHGGKKYVMHLKNICCHKDKEGRALIQPGDRLLVTGGARGITFEILKTMVAQYKTDLVIMGRSPIDDIDEDFLADSADEPFIMAQLKQRMAGVKPVELKKAAARILSIKASRANIEMLKSYGVDVVYVAADVADAEAVKSALAAANVHEKGINGVIHAAGLEESMPFEKKAFDSFLRVFNTKVQGCANIIKALAGKENGTADGTDVRFHIGFSSVTAKFGNEGQTDYTAANDMLAKILMQEAAQKSGVTCKIMDWTAWSGAGMATRETVQKVLTERGLKFLPLETGIRFFMDELEDLTTQEVVFTGLDHAFDRDGILSLAPFLDEGKSGMEVFTRHLSIEKDRFLLDHAMEGTPIFLGATGVETLAEAAMASARFRTAHGCGCKKGKTTDADSNAKHGCGDGVKPDLRVTEIKNFSIPYGIKLLQNRPKDIIVSAIPKDNGATDDTQIMATEFQCRITSQFINAAGVAMGDPKLHYESDVVITPMGSAATDAEATTETTMPESKQREIPTFKPIENSKALTEQIYHPQRLFMDDIFKTIHDILSFDGETLITQISDRSRATFFTQDPCPELLTDVILLDGMFQTGGVFEFLTESALVLPYKIGSLKFFNRGAKDADYICITTRTASDEETDTFDIDLVDEKGNYLMELQGFQMVKLHRLPEELRIVRS